MEKKTFHDFYGNLDSDDDKRASQSVGISTEEKPQGKKKRKKNKAKSKDLNGKNKSKEPTKCFDCEDSTEDKAKPVFGNFSGFWEDEPLGRKSCDHDEDIGAKLLSDERFKKFFTAVNSDGDKSSDEGRTSYDLHYEGLKNTFNPSIPVGLHEQFRNKPIGRMNILHDKRKGGPLIHTEWAGGPDPRSYRNSHAYANKIKDVTKTTEETKVKRTENDVLSAPSTVCGFCRKTDLSSLKRCARCVAVSYCSKECQRSHFDNHKLFCKRCERYDIARARVWPALRFYRDLRHDMDYTVLLQDLPTEDQYRMGIWCNLLVEVVGRLWHFCRYSCQVTDLAGEKTRIIFHDPSNVYEHPVYRLPKSLPMSLEECLRPGQFLLLMGAHWRFFADGMIGIRINDLNSVYLITMADYDIPKEYKTGPVE